MINLEIYNYILEEEYNYELFYIVKYKINLNVFEYRQSGFHGKLIYALYEIDENRCKLVNYYSEQQKECNKIKDRLFEIKISLRDHVINQILE
jgi:hypothetical protein